MAWEPTSGADPVSAEFANEFAQAYGDAWNSRDPDRLVALLSEDVRWEDPASPEGGLRGRDAVRRLVESYWRAMPDLEFEWLDGSGSPNPCLSIDRTQVAMPWRGRGTMTGPLEPPGFAPTNGRVEMVGVDVCEFRGGLACHVRSFSDTAPVARQIGAMPPPGSGGERLGVLLQRVAARKLRRKAAR
jgi:steroid delta-isomerase-like uncharacterized protein